MQTLLHELTTTLQQDDRLVIDGKLAKNKVVEMALKLDRNLLKLLLGNEKLKERFFADVDGTMVFDKQFFQKFVANKQFLPDSYTAYKNKIGLSDNGENYLAEKNDVTLIWPYKDCVLEGGQTREDAKRNEIFWNETLAPDQIDRLLDAKALTNFKKFNKEGEHPATKLSDKDNYIIKGNNLLALHSLKKKFAGKVKLVYIDPPYNTGNDDFGYNDRFNHSAWLTFMKNRLEVAYQLLSNDGSLWINIDDDEGHYLKVLADEVFKRENFVANVVWEKKYSPQNDSRWFSDMHDHIFVYAKNKETWRPNLLPRTEEMDNRYTNRDNDPRGPWKAADLSVKTYSEKNDYPITTPTGRVVDPPASRCWTVSKEKFKELIEENRIWFGEDGNATPARKVYLSEVQQGIPPSTLWQYKDVGHNQDARKEVIKLFKDEKGDFSTPKPEYLLQRIIHIGTNKDDLVLDFFAGSGTTGAVAHKMGRQYILCEQMDYVEPVTVKRLQKVVEGERGGISKEMEWHGGGSFIYAELMEYNAAYISQIENAGSAKELQTIWDSMQKNAFLSYRVDPKLINSEKDSFEELSLEEQKQFLIEVLDKNQLYVNVSEIQDEEFGVNEGDKKLNRAFYNIKS
ncbi:MAG: site-specific DNA-methyltransferase [Balneolaceae bacterium]